MRLVRQIMGMPISIDIPLAKTAADFEPAFSMLSDIDIRFSTYKPDSEVSGFAGGELNETELSGQLKSVIKACKVAEDKTGGYFSAWAGGKFDPSGYVKGWAIAEVGKLIESQGYKTYCIGAGGDIFARSDSDKTWNIGIQDPVSKNYLTSQVILKNGAVATSGSYERGSHIINPKTQQSADDFLSVSVKGPDIIWADVLATAIFAAGPAGHQLINKHPGYELFTIDKSGLAYSSSGWPNHSLESNR
jgi:thiamine biosynthesis lipoprotein